jgi:Transposase zinc-ribbon domain
VAQSLAKFRERFADEEICTAYLLQKRWPNGFICPACESRRGSLLKSRAHTYNCYGCRRQISAAAGTVMHGSKLPLTTWFSAIHLIATHRDTTSARQFETLFSIRYPTALLLKQKLRQCMAAANHEPLEGLVEVGHTEIPLNTIRRFSNPRMGRSSSLSPSRRSPITSGSP